MSDPLQAGMRKDEALDLSPSEALARTFDTVFDIRWTRPDTVIPESVSIDYDDLVAGELEIEQGAAILVVCDIGVRSRTAVTELRAQGFGNTWSLAGGADALRAHLATESGTPMTIASVERYDRQIRLSGIGVEGQRRIGSASVAVVGAGGLGNPVVTYLVAAGIGSLTIIDHDVVELSNLHRQPLFDTGDIGGSKVDRAAEHLAHLNPEVAIRTIPVRIDGSNAIAMTEGASVVVDATDSFEARYALNDAAVHHGIPLVYGSVYGFEGQYAVFDASTGPCYRCVFPDPPSDGAALDCETIGVLGPVTSVIGSLQAAAAVQLVAGVAEGLQGTLTLYDSRTARFDRMHIAKRGGCVTCG